MNSTTDIEQIEINLFLEAIFQRYGYDFRQYARASLARRIRHLASEKEMKSVSEMTYNVLRDENFFSEVVQHFSIPVTEMFRDPFVYSQIREQVVPLLRTWPSVKVWHAGCATGEEVYSVAILLYEEGLLERSTIYATDFNDAILHQAKEGIFQAEKMKKATKYYQEAGGKASFSEYYHSKYQAAVMKNFLKERLTFANHNLAIDHSFGDFHLILCCNVLIYFTRELQNTALSLFEESLVYGGFLCIGTKESLDFSPVAKNFETVDYKARIFKKISGC